jgi:hypothetical protein
MHPWRNVLGKLDPLNPALGRPYETTAWIGRPKYSSTQIGVGATHTMQKLIPSGTQPAIDEIVECHGGSPFFIRPRAKKIFLN